MQLMMLGLISLKQFSLAPLLIPLPLLTALSHLACIKLFQRPWNVLSVQDTAAFAAATKVNHEGQYALPHSAKSLHITTAVQFPTTAAVQMHVHRH